MNNPLYIDLTHDVTQNTPVYPSDEAIILKQTNTINKDSYRNSRVELSMHVGTHIDTPGHFFDTSLKVNEYNISSFISECIILDVSNKTTICLEPWMKEQIKRKKGIILYTGFDRLFNKDEYFTSHPIIDNEFAQYLVKQDIPFIGMDLPSPDISPFSIHKLFLSNNILIIENLTNLKPLLQYQNITIFALPLKLSTYGAPIRAIAAVTNERMTK